MVKIIECPRDAMQGWPHFIETSKKIEYINELLKVGFDTIDFGSFVSPKAIPQMADTKEVLQKVDLKSGKSKLLAIVANVRGAQDAVNFDEITYLGFPFSISQVFQMRNANSTIENAISVVDEIQNLCSKNSKQLVVYISMGFGNPYGDEYHPDIVNKYISQITSFGVKIISVADTVGIATPDQVYDVMKNVIPEFPSIECGVHLHSTNENFKEKIDAALKAGVNRFDSAILGIGGCPMAGNDLVGNMNTSKMVSHFSQLGKPTGLDLHQLAKCEMMAASIFI